MLSYNGFKGKKRFGVTKVKDHLREALTFIRAFARWIFIAALIGGAGGLVGAAFHVSVETATELRLSHPELIYFLPLAGLLIAAVYRTARIEGAGTDNIIDSIHSGKDVPPLLVPAIFAATVLTHLCGGSAGREGAALQIGGGIGCGIGRLVRLDEKQERLAVLSGMSAVFSALFGTPITATVFALEVCSVGVIHYSGLLPCSVAALAAFGITRLFGIAPTRFAVESVSLDPVMLLRVSALAIVCAAVSIILCELMHISNRQVRRLFRSPYIRAAVGGVLVIAMTLIVGCRDYNGAGMDVITRAIEQGEAKGEAFLLKLLFTAVTLSFGFKGGEVVPTFFIGSTLGCVVGPLLGIPAGFAAALGLAATFCGAVNCPLATVILSVELFGSTDLVYFSAACFITYMLSGYFSLYTEQRIVYSKLKAEFINRQAE